MVQFSSMFEGLARSVSCKAKNQQQQQQQPPSIFPLNLLAKGKNIKNNKGREDVVKEARKNNLILRCPGVTSSSSNSTSSVCIKKGEKGINQDCLTVWEEFGCQQDMTFCGIFDGHGPLGHFVARYVSKLLPSLLLRNWQELLAIHSLELDVENPSSREAKEFYIWKESYLRTYSVIDQELKCHPRVDSFDSGTTALAIVRQGDRLTIANVGDSRAVLATLDECGNLVPVQLTTDFKPNLPQEEERIVLSRGRVFCSRDEPGLYRLWQPNRATPGLALSRALGDHCMKDFGLISEPEVTQRWITDRDQFAILATDGVWDVISNEEAVGIVASAPIGENSSKRLVKYAANAWKSKRPGVAADDISAICMHFHSSSASNQVQTGHKSLM